MYPFTEAQKVWNRACGQAECSSPGVGDSALTALIAFHSLAMNGGMLHALEYRSEVEVISAVEGYRFFGLDQAGDMIESALSERREIQSRGDDPEEVEHLESILDVRYDVHVPDDQTLMVAFERTFERRRADFQPN